MTGRKKILFIISNLHTGGVSKSMTSLMNVIDRERYDVALMIVSPTGALMSLLPSDLRLITNPEWEALTSRLSGVKALVKMRRPLLALAHIGRLALSMCSRPWGARLMARLMPRINEEFDTVVDFNGQQQLYYMVGKLRAKKKVTFFHCDYSKWPYYYSADKKYFRKVDIIFTVSDHCVQVLRDWFPEQSHKICLMENISSPGLIRRLADSEVPEGMDTEMASLITVGHVCERKGFPLAVQAAKLLKQREVDFNWYFLGAIDPAVNARQLVDKAGLDDCVHFLGIKSNPYPYIKAATIQVHPSQFEGKSIALDEAKLMCKPVVVTDFSTVSDQFENGVNATIVPMLAEPLAHAIEQMLANANLRQKYMTYLKAHCQGNEQEVNKLYEIFDR